MIDRTYILDHEERYAPPESNVLEVGLVGDVVFLSIGKATEHTYSRGFETSESQQIAVPVTDLLNAVLAHGEANARALIARDIGEQNLTWVVKPRV
jgi:hypothetical protein